MGCGLTWSVPAHWYADPRAVLIERIKRQIRQEMGRTDLDISSLKDLMRYLEQQTQMNWRHRFYTTNWDYLLQKAISQHVVGGVQANEQATKPRWLADSHVFHLNGTAEQHECSVVQARRSDFVLETDHVSRLQSPSLELAKSLDHFAWGKVFIASGISFECQSDRQLLRLLHLIENSTPVGESQWILVNPDTAANQQLAALINTGLPAATVYTRNETFAQWLYGGLPELVALGILKQPAAQETR